MGIRRISPFNCLINCEIEDEIQEILNKLKYFEEYEIQEEKKE